LTLVDQVRRRLNEPSPVEWSDIELSDWIADAGREIARRTETLQAIGQITVPRGTTDVALPADLLRAHLILLATRPGYARILEYRERVAWDRTGSPLCFSLWGTPPVLTLWPTPVQNETLFCLYYQTGVTTPAGWDDLLVDYAEYHALRKDRDPRWSEVHGLFERKLTRMVDMTRRWVDAAGQIVEPGGAEFPFSPPTIAGEGWDVSRWDEGRWQ